MITSVLAQPLYWLLRGSNERNDPAASESVTESAEETSRYPSNEVFMTHHKDSTPGSVAQPRGDNSQIPNDSIPDSEADHVRLLPLVSSIFVPFSILLEVPGLTEHWYIRTDEEHKILEFQANPMFIQAILGVSLACAIVTNICLLVRLSEKAVRKMTISCILALTAHDTLNLIAIVIFIIKTQTDDGFILGQAFWMTLCSTVASLITNVTLIVDFWKSSPSEREKSGLTKKQRTLTAIVIVLFCYVAFGAIVNTYILSLSFIDALYFTVVCIETIGFGDIDPQTPGARVFSSCYTVGGILILAIAIGLIREALLEFIQISLYAQIRKAKRKRMMQRWLRAVKWRLQNVNLPIWVPIDEDEESECPREMELGNGRWKRIWWRWSNRIKGYIPTTRLRATESDSSDLMMRDLEWRGQRGRMRLNLQALGEAQLQAAAMEAGAPLQDILPQHPNHLDHYGHHDYNLDGGPEPISPTHHRLGRMIAVLGNFAYAVSAGQTPSRQEFDEGGDQSNDGIFPPLGRHTGSISAELTVAELEQEEKRMSTIRLAIAFTLFFTFWLVGSAIFTATEKWSYGLSLYFCFITFTTVGYGDPAPRTPAGRSIFVGWALLGVGTMTILISLLADQYSERYKNIIFAAESRIAADSQQTGAAVEVKSRVTTSNIRAETLASEKGSYTGTVTPSTNEAILSRVNELKALVVDEGPHREGKFLHTIESELQAMLSVIRHARKRKSHRVTGET